LANGEWKSFGVPIGSGIRQNDYRLVTTVTRHLRLPGSNWWMEVGMEGKGAALAKRATDFALRVVRPYRALPEGGEARVIGSQLLRSATSVAAHYRAVCKARSRGDFISKLGIVEEEADETVFWLEFLGEAGVVKKDRLRDLVSEGNELTAIFAASRKTARRNHRRLTAGSQKIREVGAL
jgi:four helix bundle protein